MLTFLKKIQEVLVNDVQENNHRQWEIINYLKCSFKNLHFTTQTRVVCLNHVLFNKVKLFNIGLIMFSYDLGFKLTILAQDVSGKPKYNEMVEDHRQLKHCGHKKKHHLIYAYYLNLFQLAFLQRARQNRFLDIFNLKGH